MAKTLCTVCGGMRSHTAESHGAARGPRKCSVCGSTGHDLRWHKAEGGPERSPAGGEPDLLSALQESVDRAIRGREQVTGVSLAQDPAGPAEYFPVAELAKHPGGLSVFRPAPDALRRAKDWYEERPDAELLGPARALLPGGDVKTLTGPDAARQARRVCVHGQWSQVGREWRCGVCGELGAPPIEEVELPEDEDGAPLPVDEDWREATPDAPEPWRSAHGLPPYADGWPWADDAHAEGPCWAPWSTPAGPDGPLRVTLPGVYQLTDLQYHDPAVTGDWVSNSDLKAMSLPGCPAKWRYNRDNAVKDERDVFQFGKAAHAEVLGTGAEVVVRPPANPADPDQVWDSWRTKAAQAWRAEQLAAGRVVVVAEEAEVITAMADAIRDSPTAAELLGRPGRAEVALFWTERLRSGRTVKRRAMLDFLPDDGPIADYKTADSAAPDDSMQRMIYRHRYHRQGATYAAAVVALGLPAEPDVVFLFQEKTAPYLVTPVVLDDPSMMVAEIENRNALEVYADCLESGVWPGYADGVVTLSIPEYEIRSYEEEIK